jgi:hypothetical protein
MKEFDTVEIVRLNRPDRPYDGTAPVMRAPRVGDTGSIVNIYTSEGEVTGYMVEEVDMDGNTIWLADFMPDEIRLVQTC